MPVDYTDKTGAAGYGFSVVVNVVVDDLSHDRIGQTIDPIQTLLIGVSGRDVRHVFVAGRMVVVDGAIPGLDVHTANVRAQAQFAGLISRYPERTVGHPPVDEIFASSYPVRRRDRTGTA